MAERGNRNFKRIDRYVGIPLVWGIGFLQRKHNWLETKAKLFNNKSPRILLLKTGAVGDSIFLSALALELKQKWPQANVTMLCTRANSGVVSLLAGVDVTFVFDLKQLFTSFFKLRKLPTYDLLIDCAAWPRLNSLIASQIRADFSVGFKRSGQYRHYVYDKCVVHKDTLHELDNYRNLLHAIDIETTGIQPTIRVDSLREKFGRSRARRGIAGLDGITGIDEKSQAIFHEEKERKKYVDENLQVTFYDLTNSKKYKKPAMLHIFPGGAKKEFKMWPDKNWLELSKQLLKKGYSIWFSGAPADKEYAEQLIAKLSRDLPAVQKKRVVNLAGGLSWEETAWLLTKVKMLVSVNTGIMHLAAALGTKVIALNGPTAVARWGAVGKQVTNFTSTYECSPCLSLGFEYACQAGGCMSRIRVDDVV